MTPTTPVALARYRESHTIEPVVRIAEYGFAAIRFCKHDGVRVYQNRRDNRWRHDKTEIKRLAALERGETE